MQTAKTRVVVTGANGYLGKVLLSSLVESADAVLCLGQRKPDEVSDRLEFCHVNLLQEIPQAALLAFQPTHLIHLAWIADHGVFWESPLNNLWVDATEKLVLAFGEAGGKHVTVTGSCAEYTWNETPCDEARSETRPSTLYGRAKLACLERTREQCERLDLELAWARVFFPYGRIENPKRLVPQVYTALKSQSRLEVCGELQRDFLFIDDAVSAVLHLALNRLIGVYNVSSGRAVELKELVQVMASVLAVPSDCITFNKLKPGTQPKLLLGINQKLLATGWRENFDLWAGLGLVNQTIISGK